MQLIPLTSTKPRDVPVVVVKHGKKRKMLERMESFQDMSELIRKRFKIPDTSDLTFEVDDFHEWKGKQVEIDESAYPSVHTFLNELTVYADEPDLPVDDHTEQENREENERLVETEETEENDNQQNKAPQEEVKEHEVEDDHRKEDTQEATGEEHVDKAAGQVEGGANEAMTTRIEFTVQQQGEKESYSMMPSTKMHKIVKKICRKHSWPEEDYGLELSWDVRNPKTGAICQEWRPCTLDRTAEDLGLVHGAILAATSQISDIARGNRFDLDTPTVTSTATAPRQRSTIRTAVSASTSAYPGARSRGASSFRKYSRYTAFLCLQTLGDLDIGTVCAILRCYASAQISRQLALSAETFTPKSGEFVDNNPGCRPSRCSIITTTFASPPPLNTTSNVQRPHNTKRGRHNGYYVLNFIFGQFSVKDRDFDLDEKLNSALEKFVEDYSLLSSIGDTEIEYQKQIAAQTFNNLNKIRWNFNGSVFACATINFGPQTCTS
ncbi:hypothetical protein V5O48_013858 [Marasmius crinis-equi]|uniref:Uncharacterized protein n=1 Tax=Marasmius crinis-equi TaxID=585013 RepID=A0ABR3EZC1_9AGAR